MTGADDDQHDLTLFFLGFTQPVLDSLHRLTPTSVNVTASPSTTHVYLGLASFTERTRSEVNKARIIAAIDAKGQDFLLALEWYRVGQEPITENDQKLTALQNYFAFGHKICQYTQLEASALNLMIEEYLKIIPTVDKINGNCNKLILSKLS